MKSEILCGVHPVREALRAGRRKIYDIVAVKSGNSRLQAVVKAAQAANIPVRQAEAEQLTRLTGTAGHQNLAARVASYPLLSLTDLVAADRPGTDNRLLLVLDSIVDPQNLGAILRTALCVNVDGVIIPRERAAAPTPAVSRASAGAMEHMRIARVTNLAVTLATLKKQGWWIYGLDPHGGLSVFEADLQGPVTLVVGSEEKGLRPLVRANCDLLLTIPQSGAVASLNASVAAAVALYEVYRQRRTGAINSTHRKKG